ncbi:unnamed protein product [Rotaria magnacalcarata]|uniref:Uncharacterized protein n=4 Tax=Rotaria magnacalcarata TaxID=392030 RepID=A0A8S2ILR8_9BILA|nr:unnamed protein product [Rotaria magnacalcarata]CAF3858282.1 unnamed protein product [Rotaria magnacalcarata]
MRVLLHEWRKQLAYFKRNNFKSLQKARGAVNTIAFFVVWGYAGYFIANRADKTAKETGIPHRLQVAKQTGSRYITKWDLNTGETEKIDVFAELAEKEAEAHIRALEQRRLQDESVQDDSLYVPATLILRQFNRFQSPSTFDKLLEKFISLFKLIPISTKKTLDDLLCIISIILTKRIMTTNDDVQQDLFIRFFRAFILSIKINSKLLYKDFLGNFSQNLPIVGHYLSCLLQLYEKINSLDYRLNIIDALWSLIYVQKDKNENEYKSIIGQVLACFLPGILKTFAQDINSIHQRLVQASLILLSYVVRLSVNLSPKYNDELKSMKDELRDMVVERNEQWLCIVDTHLAPVLQRLTTDCVNHESLNVRRALANFMLTILCFCSAWLKISANIALKTMLVLISSAKNDENEIILMKVLLKKLFKLPIESIPIVSSQTVLTESSFHLYETELINEILNASNIILPDHLLIECQSDLFQLLDQQQKPSSSSLLTDRRWRLQLFIGYYTFIRQHVDFLLDMDSFTEKFLRFILNALDFDTIIRSNLNLLNESSLSDHNTINFKEDEYHSVYKHFKSDVHDEIQQILKLFISSHSKFLNYLFEKINSKKIIEENNLKTFYLLSIIFEEKNFDNFDDYQLLLSLLIQLICDDDYRKQQVKRRKRNRPKKEEPISMRNLTIYFLLEFIRTITRIDQVEYLIDYIPLLLLCHSSKYTIVHQTSLYCLTSLSNNIPSFLVTQSEYIIDSSLRKLQTSSYDGYFILIEFIRLGNTKVINLPIMTHVIEQLLLELSCLPPIECIELTFQFLHVFCQQVFDIVDEKKIKSTLLPPQTKSLIDFTLDLQQQYAPPNPSNEQINDENEKQEEKHPWHKMLVSIVDVFQHFISHSNIHVRSYVLDAFPSLAQLLSTIDENLFLPLVHKLWPGLIHRLYDKDFNIRMRCLSTVQCLCRLCSDFVDRRIRQDILPILIQHLENNRLISPSKKLEYRYMKCLLTNIGSILNAITVNIEDMERIVLILFQYLQVEQLADHAYEQLILLTEKYSDMIWLKLMLHEETEYRKGHFEKMKVYKPEPMLIIDPKWKSSLLVCLTKC